MAKMVNFGLAYGMSDFGLSSRANIPRQEAQDVHQLLLRRVLRHQLLHARHQGAGEGPGLRRDAARAQAPDPRAPRREPGAARGRRADGDQHADPGHRRRHPEDRDDPARRAAPRQRVCARGCCCRSTTSCCSRCRATRSSRSRPLCARRWRARCRSVPLTVDVKVGDDWESMTPLTRADAIPAEADEVPLEAPVAPIAGLAPTDAGAARGRNRRPRPRGRALVGARSSASASSWLTDAAVAGSEAFADGGRRPVGRGRRASRQAGRPRAAGDAALTIHLKMTGQLFVVPAGTPEDPYVRLVLEFEDGRELRFRDIRKFGRVGLYGRDPATGDLEGELGGAAGFEGFGPEPLDAAFTLREFRRADPPPQGPAQAAAARPGVPGRRRQHLRRRGAVGARGCIRCGRRRRCAARRAPAVRARSGRSSPRPSSAAARRSTTTRRPRATARCRSTCDVYQRTGEPCPRCGRPVRRIVIGARSTHFCSWCQRLPAAASGRAPPRSCGR